MKSEDIKPSALDKNIPDGYTVMYQLYVIPGGRAGRGTPPPIVLFNTASLEACRSQFAIEKRRFGSVSYTTWWKENVTGKHVPKWPTLNAGKRRFFSVSVPFVAGLTDGVVRDSIQRAIVTYASTTGDISEYREPQAVKVNARSDWNAAQSPTEPLPPVIEYGPGVVKELDTLKNVIWDEYKKGKQRDIDMLYVHDKIMEACRAAETFFKKE